MFGYGKTKCENVAAPRAAASFGLRERWRGTGPRPTVRVAFFIVARGPVPRDLHRQEWCLRSFRTYMSIEKRVVLFSRSLIKTRAALAKTIKDLKDLRVLRGRACYRH